MKITTWEKTTEIELDATGYNTHMIDVHKLVERLRGHFGQIPLAMAASSAGVSPSYDLHDRVTPAFEAAATGLSLAAGQDDAHDATPEELVSLFAEYGDVSFEQDPDTGEILSIHASAVAEIRAYADGSTILEFVQATVTPAKLVGDLAQTSVGAVGSETQVIGLSEWTIDWKRKTADATTTDNNTYESSLGSTASWSVKAKYMYIDADPSQSANILATITNPQNPQPWNFFPTIATGRLALSGLAYVDGITISSGMGKCVGLDVSLKGTGALTVGVQIAPVANATTGTGEQAEV